MCKIQKEIKVGKNNFIFLSFKATFKEKKIERIKYKEKIIKDKILKVDENIEEIVPNIKNNTNNKGIMCLIEKPLLE